MKQILLVDDSHFFIQAIKELLKRPENRILTASCGRDAIQTIERHSPDVVLIDFYLDDMRGDDCCGKIKSNPATKDIPVIMLTSAGNYEDIEQSKDAGCDDYITKPVDKMALLAKVKRYLSIPTREQKRAPICVPVTYYHENDKYSGMIFCISEGGMFIKEENLLESGSIIQVSFSIPHIAGDIEVKAEVAWNTAERSHLAAGVGPGFGVRFLSIDEEGVEAIRKYVGLGDYLL